MTFKDTVKSNILKNVDNRLQKELSNYHYSFIATVKLNKGDSFHDVVDVIFDRDGAEGLKDFLDRLIVMVENFHRENDGP